MDDKSAARGHPHELFVYVIRVGTGEPLAFLPGYVRLQEWDFPVTEKAGRTRIAIPFHNNLTPEEVEYVAQVLEEGIRTA